MAGAAKSSKASTAGAARHLGTSAPSAAQGCAAAVESSSTAERFSSLSTPTATRLVLEAHGLSAKYSLGQNFLVNDDILRRIIELAEVNTTDDVLEIGPGIGTLTMALLKHARRVVAIERDPDLPAVLDDTLHSWQESFTLIQKDALDVQATDLPFAPTKLVANLPYAVAATVVLDYFELFPSLQSATVMVQKEVADRMAAQVGTKNYGAYTVKLGMYATPAGRFLVGPGNFFPPPRVDSSVIRLNRSVPVCAHGEPATPDLVRAACLMADASFTNRRKTLANSCKAYFARRGFATEVLPALFEAAGIDARRRGETLSQSEFLALGEAYLRTSPLLPHV